MSIGKFFEELLQDYRAGSAGSREKAEENVLKHFDAHLLHFQVKVDLGRLYRVLERKQSRWDVRYDATLSGARTTFRNHPYQIETHVLETQERRLVTLHAAILDLPTRERIANLPEGTGMLVIGMDGREEKFPFTDGISSVYLDYARLPERFIAKLYRK